MVSAVVVGHLDLTHEGRVGMLVFMALLLGLSAVVPMQCSSWTAVYGETCRDLSFAAYACRACMQAVKTGHTSVRGCGLLCSQPWHCLH